MIFETPIDHFPPGQKIPEIRVWSNFSSAGFNKIFKSSEVTSFFEQPSQNMNQFVKKFVVPKMPPTMTVPTFHVARPMANNTVKYLVPIVKFSTKFLKV